MANGVARPIKNGRENYRYSVVKTVSNSIVEKFVEFVFNRGARVCDPWYFDESYIEVPFSPGAIVSGAGHIFSNISSYGKLYSDDQIVLGLRFLIDKSASDLPMLFFLMMSN